MGSLAMMLRGGGVDHHARVEIVRPVHSVARINSGIEFDQRGISADYPSLAGPFMW
jgi:hypothetical protein